VQIQSRVGKRAPQGGDAASTSPSTSEESSLISFPMRSAGKAATDELDVTGRPD
jgi:hypothetical protein